MKKILVLGDSHSSIFGEKIWLKKANMFDWNLVIVPGATLSGLSNPYAKTNSAEKFSSAINNTDCDFIVTLLGEVDCGYVIWYYAQRDGLDVKDAANKAIENYKNLLLKASLKSKIFVISAPLPTIKEGEIFGEVATERWSMIKSTQKERTLLTLWFNVQIKSFCLENNLEFIDLDMISSGYDGIVSASLINPNKCDHHYKKSSYLILLLNNFLPRLLFATNMKLPSVVAKYQMTDEDTNSIRDIGLYLEDKDISRAYTLMNIAFKLRPNGALIRQKIKNFKMLMDTYKMGSNPI